MSKKCQIVFVVIDYDYTERVFEATKLHDTEEECYKELGKLVADSIVDNDPDLENDDDVITLRTKWQDVEDTLYNYFSDGEHIYMQTFYH